MKIVHFVSGVKSGGAEQMLINYSRYLNNECNFSQVIVYQHEPDEVCLNRFLQAGNRCIKISDKRRHPLRNLMDSYRILKSEKPDIVHCHMSLLNVFPLLVATICGIKVRICHSHISENNTGLKRIVKVLKVLNVFFATQLVACGVDAGKFMYGNRKFKIIRNAVDLGKFADSENDFMKLKSSLNIPENSLVVGHIGRFVDQKNHVRVLKIFKAFYETHDDAYLILIGDGPLKRQIEDETRNSGISDHVKFIGTVSDVSNYYAMMDVFILPSKYEGLPVVAVEAQAAGVPILLSDNIDSDIHILKTTHFLSLTDSDAKWVAVMDTAIHAPIESRETIARIMTQKEFSLESEEKKLRKYYLGLVEF